MKVSCNLAGICKHKCGAKNPHDPRDCEPCPKYPHIGVKCRPVEEEKPVKKLILFTLGDGSEVHFGTITGFPDPKTENEEELKIMASAAMDTDDRIVSFRIVDMMQPIEVKTKKQDSLLDYTKQSKIEEDWYQPKRYHR
jgi:hypothetical protein